MLISLHQCCVTSIATDMSLCADAGIWAATAGDGVSEREDGSWWFVIGCIFTSVGPVLCTGALCAVSEPLHTCQSRKQEGENRITGETAWRQLCFISLSLLLYKLECSACWMSDLVHRNVFTGCVCLCVLYQTNRTEMTSEAKRAAKLEKKLKILLGGYQVSSRGWVWLSVLLAWWLSAMRYHRVAECSACSVAIRCHHVAECFVDCCCPLIQMMVW